MARTDQMEIDAIDSLLGEENQPRRRPRIEQPAPMVQETPLVGGLSTGPYAAFSREPSGSDAIDVGARGGATTQPVGSPRPVDPVFGASGVFDPEDRRPDPPPLVPSDQSAPPAPRPAPQTTTGSSGAGMDIGVRSTGARAAGDTASAGNPQEAYNNFTGMVDPNASQGDMESAIEASFGHLPGYGGAYKESVMLNGKWYDLVGGYGGPNASFHGLMEKKGGKGSFGAGLFPEGGGVPQIDNTSRLDQILASIDAMARGEGSPLVKQSIDELLGGGAVATPEAVTPMVDQSPMRRSRGGNARNMEAILSGI